MKISRARHKPFSFFGNNKLSYSIQALTNQMSKQNKEWKRTAGVGIQHYTPHLFTVNRPTADPGIVTFSWQQTTSLAHIKKLKSRELLKLVEKDKKQKLDLMLKCWVSQQYEHNERVPPVGSREQQWSGFSLQIWYMKSVLSLMTYYRNIVTFVFHLRKLQLWILFLKWPFIQN